MECLFCSIVAGKIPAHCVYEDDTHLAFLDIYPKVTGHTLVIPKEHHSKLFEMPEAAYLALWKAVRTVEARLKKAAEAEWVFVRVIGLDVPHVHVHLEPQAFAGIKNATDFVDVKKKILVYS
jgi:histidine triad (HIT) family protein